MSSILLSFVALLASGGTKATTVVDIAADPCFDHAIALEGMQHPDRFRYTGIYTAEPVDPAREIVLFVHGAEGTPRDFLAVAATLDPVTQQAWFAYYPTGRSLAESGHTIAEATLREMRRNHITRIKIVAHSLGGLVAWRVIAELREDVDVEMFVSVNTPWNGFSAARFGVWFSPSPLPIWVDLAPGSRALRTIQSRDLNIPFTLVYTVKSTDPNSDGDGVVSRSSETLPALRRQASHVVEEVGSHSSVLTGDGAARIGALLASPLPHNQREQTQAP